MNFSEIKKAKGQASVEFIPMMLIIMAMFLWMLNIAINWHGFHLAGLASLHGASAEGKQPGGYSLPVQQVNNWAPPSQSFEGSVIVHDNGSLKGESIFEVEINGTTSQYIGMPIIQMNDVQIRTSAVVPHWQFVP
jgi:hypothetical protein